MERILCSTCTFADLSDCFFPTYIALCSEDNAGTIYCDEQAHNAGIPGLQISKYIY